ncbi:MAG: hypothetical protein ABJH05_18440 [Fulvivirga sp.]
MENKVFGLTGILSFILPLIGFLTLFQINPQALIELDLLALSYYNIIGADGQLWTKWVIYIATGLTSLLTLTGLLIQNKKNTQIIIGLSFLMASSLIWVSFGLVDMVPDDMINDSKLVLMRTIIFMLTSIIGFLLIGTDLMKIRARVFVKWMTLTVAIMIGTLGSLSTFVFNDETYIRTNSSLALYFIWLGIIGFLLLTEKKNR